MQNRNVLVVLSSSPIHAINTEQLSHISLIHIPTHHLAVLQPGNHGIVRNFRARYRRLLLEKLVFNQSLLINSYEAILLLSTAWNELPRELIRAAFVKAGLFKTSEILPTFCEYIDFDCAHLLSKAAELGLAVPQSKYSFQDYVAIDESLCPVDCNIGGILEEFSISNDESNVALQLPENDETEQIFSYSCPPVPCSLTVADAQDHLCHLRSWAMSRPTCPLHVHNALSTLESFILGHNNN